MVLPAFATVEELAFRIPGGIATEDVDRAEAALADASALIRAEAGKTWVNDLNELSGVPDAIVAVTIAASRRALTNPDGVASETVPDYSRTFAATSLSADIYLTKGERRVVLRAAGRSGLWTLATTRRDLGGDVQPVTAGYAYAVDPVPPEEYDPYSEGWPG